MLSTDRSAEVRDGSLSARFMSFDDPNLPQINQSVSPFPNKLSNQSRGSSNRDRSGTDQQFYNGKIKVYSKLANIVGGNSSSQQPKTARAHYSTTTSAGLSHRTPTAKKRTKANSSSNKLRTSSSGKSALNPNATTGMNSSARPPPNNQTFEHIKNAIRSVERKKKGMTKVPSGGSIIQSGAQTTRAGYNRSIRDYSPASMSSRSPTGPTTHTNTKSKFDLSKGQDTIFSNFSNQTYYTSKKSGTSSMTGSVGKRRSSSRRDDSDAQKSTRNDDSKKKRDSMSIIYLKQQQKTPYNPWFSPSGVSHAGHVSSVAMHDDRHRSQLVSPRNKNNSGIHNEKAKFQVESKRSMKKTGGSVDKFPTSGSGALIGDNAKQDRIVMPVDRHANSSLHSQSAKQLFSKTLQSPPRSQNAKGVHMNLKGGKAQYQASIHTGGYQTQRVNDSKTKPSDHDDQLELELIRNVKFFAKFKKLKPFKMWKWYMWNKQYYEKRQKLAQTWIFTQQPFSDCLNNVFPLVNQVSQLKFFDQRKNMSHKVIQNETTFSKNTKARSEQSHKMLKGLFQSVKVMIEKLKDWISMKEDEMEKRIKEEKAYQKQSQDKKRYDQYDVQAKGKKLQELEQEFAQTIDYRRRTFDSLIELLLRYLLNSLSSMVYENRRDLAKIFDPTDSYNIHFELTVLYDQEGAMTTVPSYQEFSGYFTDIFEDIENSVFSNKKVLECTSGINKMFFKQKKWQVEQFFEMISKSLKEKRNHQVHKEQIFIGLKEDINALKEYMKKVAPDANSMLTYYKDWKQKQSEMEGSAEDSSPVDFDYCKQVWQDLERFQDTLNSLQEQQATLQIINLNTLQLKKTLTDVHSTIMSQMEGKMKAMFEQELNTLSKQLSEYYNILSSNAGQGLNIYMDQIVTIKKLRSSYTQLEDQLKTLKKLYAFQTGGKQECEPLVEIEDFLQSLPSIILQTEEQLSMHKPQMQQQILEQMGQLHSKIMTFKQKYIQSYMEDPSRLGKAQETFDEINAKTATVEEIGKKIKLYQECIDMVDADSSALPSGAMTPALSTVEDQECYKSYDDIKWLHDNTLEFWSLIKQFLVFKTKVEEEPFKTLDLHSICDGLTKISKFLDKFLQGGTPTARDFLNESLNPEQVQEVFGDSIRKLSQYFYSDFKDFLDICTLFLRLKADTIKNRHWIMIINLLSTPERMLKLESITLQNLRDCEIQLKFEEIEQIIKHSNNEMMIEEHVIRIRNEMHQMELKMTIFNEHGDDFKDQNGNDIYVMSDFDATQGYLEELQVGLECMKNSIYAVPHKDEMVELIKTFKVMKTTYEKWQEAQKFWSTLKIIFNNSLLQSLMKKSFVKFLEHERDIVMIGKNTTKNQNTYYNLYIQQNRSEIFDKIINEFTLIQKQVEDYIEARRLAFPRFFFMNDFQFLQCVAHSNSHQMGSLIEVNKYITIMFPGAQKLFFDKQEGAVGVDKSMQMKSGQQGAPPTLINDISAVRSELIDLSCDTQLNMTDSQAMDERAEDLSELRAMLSSPSAQLKAHNLKNFDLKSSQGPSKRNASNSVGRTLTQTASQGKLASPKNQNLQQAQQLVAKEILGMMSHQKELFMFERKIRLSSKIETWLQETESAMQETVGKMINYAVNSFPKQSLDEWILDYPQQIILTTIHLILTHEINELFEEFRRVRQSKKPEGKRRERNYSPGSSGSYGDEEDEEDDMYEEEEDERQHRRDYTHKTPDTRDLIKHSQISQKPTFNNGQPGGAGPSQKSSFRMMRQGANMSDVPGNRHELGRSEGNQNLEGTSNIRREFERVTSHRLGGAKGKAQDSQTSRGEYESHRNEIDVDVELEDEDEDDENFSESREREKFAINMFGSDFDIKVISDDREETMRILQEKSFRGLFLRLQFWINQICKSLNGQRTSESLQLTYVHKTVMSSIISFLSYMRDVVHEMQMKNIENIEDYDWQKQMRLTWNGKDQGCKVDCGAWTTYQGNEYLGSLPRLALTPLTNRYFVFISAAFREKSAVLFKCVPDQPMGGEIFEEFSNICTVPFKQYLCNESMSMRSLMQYLNGAALASVWIFFEHIDKLEYIHLQTFNKEIQMVQQQFIIAELSQDSSVITAHITVGSHSQSHHQHLRSVDENRNSQGPNDGNNDEKAMKRVQSKERLDRVKPQPPGNDIKIEDNYEDISSSMQEQQIEELSNQNWFAKRNRQSEDAKKVQEKILTHLQDELQQEDSQRAAEAASRGNEIMPDEDEPVAIEDEELELDDEKPNENTVQQTLGLGANTGINACSTKVHKICFGVFASISAEFIEKNKQVAEEVANSLQSAFRVLSLNKPEIELQCAVIMKARGFKNYKELIKTFVHFQSEFRDEFCRLTKAKGGTHDKEVPFSIRDIQTLLKITQILVEQQWSVVQQEKDQLKQVKLNQPFVLKQKKSGNRSEIVQDQEEEEHDTKADKDQRRSLEFAQFSKAIRIFYLDRYTYLNTYFGQELEGENFVLQCLELAIKNSFDTKDLSEETSQGGDERKLQKRIVEIFEEMDLTPSLRQVDNMVKLVQIFEQERSKSVAIIGQTASGKTTLLKVLEKYFTDSEGNCRFNGQQVSARAYSVGEIFGSDSCRKPNENSIRNSILSQIMRGLSKKSGSDPIKAMEFLEDWSKYNTTDIKAVIFDGEIQQALTECLMQVCFEKPSEQINYSKFSGDGEVGMLSRVTNNHLDGVKLMIPNGLVYQIPRNLYFVFEAPDLANATPSIVTNTNIILTQKEDIDFKSYLKQMLPVFYDNSQAIFGIYGVQKKEAVRYLDGTIKEFIIPLSESIHKKYQKFSKNQNDQPQFDLLSLTIHFAKFFNSLLLKLKKQIKSSQGGTQNHFNNTSLMSLVSNLCLFSIFNSFAAVIQTDIRTRVFNDLCKDKAIKQVFSQQIGMASPDQMFTSYYDIERLQWISYTAIDSALQSRMIGSGERLLVVQNPDLSSAYVFMDLLVQNEHNTLIVGPQCSQKSMLMKLFVNNNQSNMRITQLPMSSFLQKKDIIRKILHQTGKKDQDYRKIGFVIEDIHMNDKLNYSYDVFEFLRIWNQSKGFYDGTTGFKQVADPRLIMNQCTRNTKGHPTSAERLTYYTNTIYMNRMTDQFVDQIFLKLTSQQIIQVSVGQGVLERLSNIVREAYSLCSENQGLNQSQFTKLSSMHHMCSLSFSILAKLENTNYETFDQLALDTIRIIELFFDRCISPKTKVAALLHMEQIVKQQLNIQEIKAEKVKDEIKIENPLKLDNIRFYEDLIRLPKQQERINKIQDFFGLNSYLMILSSPSSGARECVESLQYLPKDPYVLFEAKTCQKAFDSIEFSNQFKQMLLLAAPADETTNFIFMVDDSKLECITYIDFLMQFDRLGFSDKLILNDPQFKEQLRIKLGIPKKEKQRALSPGRQGAIIGKTQKETVVSDMFDQAYKRIKQRIRVVVLVSKLKNYSNWVQFNPQVEMIFSIMCCGTITKEAFEAHQPIEEENVLINEKKLMNQLSQVNQILVEFTEQSQYSKAHQLWQQSQVQDAERGELNDFYSPQHLNGKFVFQDQAGYTEQQIGVKQGENCISIISSGSPYQLVSISRSSTFLSTFSMIHTQQTALLQQKIQYYQSILKKIQLITSVQKEQSQIMRNLGANREDQNHLIERFQEKIQVLNLKNKIQQLKHVIDSKDYLLRVKEREIQEYTRIYQQLSSEVNGFLKEKETKFDSIIQAMKTCQEEVMALVRGTLKENKDEKILMRILITMKNLKHAKDINSIKDVEAREVKEENIGFRTCFGSMGEFLGLITETRQIQVKKQQDQQTNCRVFGDYLYIKLKQINLKKVENIIYQNLYKFLTELYRKLSVREQLKGTYSKMLDVKDRILSNSLQIAYTKKFIQDAQEELEDFAIKERNIQQLNQETQSEPQLLQMIQTADSLKNLMQQGEKAQQKLDKLKIRIKNLTGDSFILAVTLCYLGIFNEKQRMQIRKQISENLSNEEIESSECWISDQEPSHCKLFKKIMSDIGLNKLFYRLSHIYSENTFAEIMFQVIYAPSSPVIFDSVGYFQNFLLKEFSQCLNEQEIEELGLNEGVVVSKIFKSPIFGSDYLVGSKLACNVSEPFQSSNQQIIMLNDVNDHSKHIYGKVQDSPYISWMNNLNKKTELRVPAEVGSNCSNPAIAGQPSILSLHKVMLFTAHANFNMGQSALSNQTIVNSALLNKNEAWIEIKEILLKHFLPENYQKLKLIKEQVIRLKEKIDEGKVTYERTLLMTKESDLQTLLDPQQRQLPNPSYETLILALESFKNAQEEYLSYNNAFHTIINEHPLLASYSNIFVILYCSLKQLSKLTDEITYSWKIYIKIIDMIIAKIIRDLTMNIKQKEQDGGKGTPGKSGAPDREFTIDEEFFHSVIMPSIYSTIMAGIKQENIALFNLLFSLEIALKKQSVRQEDKEFFLNHFFQLPNCKNWRVQNSDFCGGHTRMQRKRFIELKRELLKLYPDTRRFFEAIEVKLGGEYSFKDAGSLIYKKLFNNDFKDLSLVKKINLGLLCPDTEFKSKICQFVYEELTTIFDFTEELTKLHNFIKTASWSLPVALFTQNSINIVNTVCSIASYYGVGLEVLRTDYQHSKRKNPNFFRDKSIEEKLIPNHDYQSVNVPGLAYTGEEDQEISKNLARKLSRDAASTINFMKDENEIDIILAQRECLESMFCKDELDIDDKQITTQSQSSIQLIEKCAENGTWVLISTLKFPSFWHQISKKLEHMHKEGRIVNTFRLFFDLQGYSLQEIPESFLFDNCVKFYLTERNNEDMEGFNDVWANILNDDILNAKELNNVPVLEQPSELARINLNLQSNIFENSRDRENHNPNDFRGNERHGGIPNLVGSLGGEFIQSSNSDRHGLLDTLLLPDSLSNQSIKRSEEVKFTAKLPKQIITIPDQLEELPEQFSAIMKESVLYGDARGSLPDIPANSSILFQGDVSRADGSILSKLNREMVPGQKHYNMKLGRNPPHEN